MFSKFKKGLLAGSIFFASTVIINTTYASDNPSNQKGTMGYGYQQYLEKHPDKASQQKQESGSKSMQAESGTTQSGERVLDIS
ncbi:lysozyme, partial [Staphylococcus hominis]